jgi:septal ring factor EnvC (AmiA/AmiB activator)
LQQELQTVNAELGEAHNTIESLRRKNKDLEMRRSVAEDELAAEREISAKRTAQAERAERMLGRLTNKIEDSFRLGQSFVRSTASDK